MTLLSNHFYSDFYFYFFCANYCVVVPLILVDVAAGYGLPPSQSFYFLLWASRRLYCHNNNNGDRLKTANIGYSIELYILKFTQSVLFVFRYCVSGIVQCIHSLRNMR